MGSFADWGLSELEISLERDRVHRELNVALRYAREYVLEIHLRYAISTGLLASGRPAGGAFAFGPDAVGSDGRTGRQLVADYVRRAFSSILVPTLRSAERDLVDFDSGRATDYSVGRLWRAAAGTVGCRLVDLGPLPVITPYG